jgi:hypothetical protein
MAVEMIGGPRLCEPLLATGLGRFTGAASRHANGPRKRTSPHWRSGWVSGASQRATTNSLGTTSQPCASLPPWHSGFNQLSLDPSTTLADLFTLLLFADLSFAIWAFLKRWSNDEFDDGVAHGRQGRLRRRAVDSFFSDPLVRGDDAGGMRKRSWS